MTTRPTSWTHARSRRRTAAISVLSAAICLGAGLFPAAGANAQPTRSDAGTADAAGLRVDAQVAGHQSSAASTISAPALTTSGSGDLLLAFVATSGPAGTKQTIGSVSGGGLSWTLRQRANGQRGSSEVWQAVAPTVVKNLVVTATRAGASSTGSIVVTAFGGASTTVTGATRGASAASGAPSIALTPTKTGSWIWAVGNDGSRSVARVAGTNQTKADEFLTRTRSFWVQRQNAPSTSTSLASTTINDTSPTDDAWNLAAVEIVPAGSSPQSGDTRAPVISARQVSNVQTTSATVSWTTDEAASTQVAYGASASYGSATSTNATKTTSHSQTLTGLSAGTTYHYQVRSADAAGNLASSGDATFTTATATSTGPTTPATFSPGNPNSPEQVPSGMGLEDVSSPDQVVGTGTAASCTSAAVVAAVAAGGVITFSCGPDPVTITLDQTLKVRNSTAKLIIDGGGLVTLSGGGKNRILYIDTCDTSLGSVSGNCLYAPEGPKVTVQNIILADGNATNAGYVSPGDTDNGSNGGGAIFALGGRLKVVRSVFVRNSCAPNGPDLGGGAIRVLAQHSPTPEDFDNSYAARNQDPAVIVQSTFGGADGQGNSCSNGGAVSSLRSSVTMINSLVSYNSAVGCCSNPANAGTPGGGSGGATYSDGDSFEMKISGTLIDHNSAKAGGSAIFFVSNDKTGHLSVRDSVSQNNSYTLYQGSDQHFQNYPGIFYLSSGDPDFTNSTIK